MYMQRYIGLYQLGWEYPVGFCLIRCQKYTGPFSPSLPPSLRRSIRSSVRLSATVSVALDFSSNICCNLLTEYILCFVYFLFSAGCFSIYFHVLRSFVAYFILRLLVIATAAVIVAAVAAIAVAPVLLLLLLQLLLALRKICNIFSMLNLFTFCVESGSKSANKK